MSPASNITFGLILTSLAAVGAYLAGSSTAQESKPTSKPTKQRDVSKDFEQILPRGRIRAIRQPRYVKGAQAKIPEDAWVLGLVIDGQARAYSLNLLNRHEIVNDVAGDTPFAAVW